MLFVRFILQNKEKKINKNTQINLIGVIHEQTISLLRDEFE